MAKQRISSAEIGTDRIRIALLGPAMDLQGEAAHWQGRVRISSAMEKQGYAQLDRDRAIIRWKENHPGALIRHESLCGLTVMGHSWMLNDGEAFAVVDNDEFLERYWRPYGTTNR